ncbi:unnamed protein product [Allacma fusca]|uniref:Uncharacterized protein n=1 Tax=Allacma fusca TaxID=39272 RepID=A0A8J2MFR2_9HEXA|nr:unnamed protein product [Allacma fusca]
MHRGQELKRTTSKHRGRHGRYKKNRVIYADSIISTSTIEIDRDRTSKTICQCGCFRRRKSLNLVPDYVVSPPQSRRTVHTIQFIHDTYDRLLENANDSEYEWSRNTHCEITEAFKHCRRGLRFLQLLNMFAEESLQSLSYYLEDNLSEKQIGLTECRSIIGSYTWLIVLCLQSILDPAKILERKEFHHLLRDIANLSVKNWVGIVRTVDFFIKVRMKTEHTIEKYIVPVDLENQGQAEGHAKGIREKELPSRKTVLGEDRKAKLRKLKLYNKVGHHSIGVESPSENSSDFSKFQVVKKPEKEDPHNSKDWTRFEGDSLEDQKEEVLNLCKYVKEILRDVHLNIHFIEKYMNQCQDKSSAENANSYSEAILLLRRALKSLSKQEIQQRNLRLTDENRIAMVVMGKILEDSLELTEYFLMSLRSLLYESRHAVHVVYEFCRMYHNCKIPRYDIAASVDRRKLLEQFKAGYTLRAKIDRNSPTTDELPLTRETTLEEIQGSPYVQMLQVFSLNANGCQYKIIVDSIPMSEAPSSGRKLSPNGVSHVQ